tara:strand:+ start:36222 stop:36566 length:345 start_codon:yes stop_codon:yes gene_type:complete
MTNLRPSVELCSLSVLGDLIQLDEGTALKIFSELCGMNRETGLSAIRTFQNQIKRDARWLDVLAQITESTVRDNPQAVLTLLTEGFGLYELDAMDVVIRLCERATDQGVSHILN